MAEMHASCTQEVSLEAVVTRCGCTPEQKRARGFHGAVGRPCPNPLAIEDRGTVAYWHRNPLRRWGWRVGQWLQGRRPRSITVHR